MNTESIWRIRRIAVVAALTALAFVQSPGLVTADTKVDLTLSPGSFLVRAMSMWDPAGFAGQVQNQAYGYLFPMGPFFAAGHALGLPAWVVERLWWSLLLGLAFVGMAALARTLRIGDPVTQILAGIGYALSPRILTTLGAVSAEAWPMALAPWVVIPLVYAAQGRRGWRAAALTSAAAVACMGGINATLTLAATLPAALYLATRRPLGRALRLFVGWSIAVIAGAVWWMVPLVLLGRYTPPFLDYIERAATTTSPTSLFDSLRGASHWVAYLGPALGSLWRSGNDLVTMPLLIGYTGILLTLGLLGLAMRTMPERLWLLSALAVGAVALTAGHSARFGSPVAEPVQAMLDGPLAPLRNVHKFDVLVRMPVLLGLAHVLAELPHRWRERPRTQPLAWGLVALGVLAVVGSATPAAVSRLAPSGAYTDVPDYWRDTGQWLSGHDDGRALLAPASRFASYFWGATGDEPLQALTSGQWEVRNAIPLVPVGHIQMLDSIEAIWAAGRPSTSVAGYLASQGIRYVVVRHDLDYVHADSIRPGLVDAVILTSPGFSLAAQFGPPVSDFSPRNAAQLAVPASLMGRPMVEIWQVEAAASAARSVAEPDLAHVVGDARAVPVLHENGLDTGPVTTGPATVRPTAPIVVTDSLRRVQVDFGRSTDNHTSTLAAGSRPLAQSGPMDYLDPGAEAAQTSLTWVGATSVVASSSISTQSGLSRIDPTHGPEAAFDGDPATTWTTADSRRDPDPAITIDFGDQVTPGVISLSFDESSWGRIEAVTVEANGQGRSVPVSGRTVTLPAVGLTTRVRLALQRRGADDFPISISEIAIAGHPVQRSYLLPQVDNEGRPAAIAVSEAPGRNTGCLADGNGAYCSTLLESPGEDDAGLDRLLKVSHAEAWKVAGSVLPRGGPALDEIVQASLGSSARATASSRLVADLRSGPLAALDGNDATAWIAAGSDPTPSITVDFGQPRTLSTIRLLPPAANLASTPTNVTVTTDAGRYARVVDSDGAIALPSQVTTRLTISIQTARERYAYDPVRQTWDKLPAGISEIELNEQSNPAWSDARIDSACGQGPTLTIGQTSYLTAVQGSVFRARDGFPVDLQICGPSTLDLAEGPVRLRLPSTDAWWAHHLSLINQAWQERDQRAVPVIDPVDPLRGALVASPSPEANVVALAHNVNAGWQARVADRLLTPVTIDGWQQGFVVPAAVSGVITPRFAPANWYRVGLTTGMLLLAALLFSALTVGGGPTTALTHMRTPPLVQVVGAIAVLTLLGGWIGSLLAVGTLVTRRWWGQHPDRGALLVVGIAATGATAWSALWPWGNLHHSQWTPAVQILTLAAVAMIYSSPGPRRPAASLVDPGDQH